jgi:hypothetical protein
MNNSVVEIKIRYVVFAFVSVEFGEKRGGGEAAMFLYLRKTII